MDLNRDRNLGPEAEPSQRDRYIPSPNEEQLSQIRRMARLGIRPEVIAGILGVEPELLLASCGQMMAECASRSHQAVLECLQQMATSGKNFAAASFWLQIQGAKPCPKNNDGEPNADH